MLCVSHWDCTLWQGKKYDNLTVNICHGSALRRKLQTNSCWLFWKWRRLCFCHYFSWLLSSTKILHFCYNHFIKLIVLCFLHFQLVITEANTSLLKLIPSKSKFHVFWFSTYIALSAMEKLAQNGKIFFALCSTATINNAPNSLISVLLVLKPCHRYELLHQYCGSRQGTMTEHVRQTSRQGKVKNATQNYIAMEMLLQSLCWLCPKTMPCVPFWTDSFFLVTCL